MSALVAKEVTGELIVSSDNHMHKTTVKKLAMLATSGVYTIMKEVDGVDAPYNDEQMKSLDAIIEETYEQYLNDVFNYETRLDEATWKAKMAEKKIASWLFDSGKLREKVTSQITA